MTFELKELKTRVYRTIEAVRNQLSVALSKEYPTDSPRGFLSYLDRTITGLERFVQRTTNQDTIQLICSFILDVSAQLRFVESATYPKIPWALIETMEKLLAELSPGAKVVLRAKSTFNYEVLTISRSYQDALKAIPKIYLEDSVFSTPEELWNVVSLPAVDADNVLMHVILGHESGHSIAKQILDDEDRAPLNDEIKELIGDAKWIDPDIETKSEGVQFETKTNMYYEILEYRMYGLVELISDVVALQLFGPSYLFAIRSFSLHEELDTKPTYPDCYPPWRFRYRVLLEESKRLGHLDKLGKIEGSSAVSSVRTACATWLAGLETLVQARSDIKIIEAEPVIGRVYRSIHKFLPTVSDAVRRKLGNLGYSMETIHIDLPHYIDLLSMGVPPSCEAPRQGDYRDVFLAGWLYRLAQLPVPLGREGGWETKDDFVLARLIHKALEYAGLAKSYADFKHRKGLE